VLFNGTQYNRHQPTPPSIDPALVPAVNNPKAACPVNQCQTSHTHVIKDPHILNQLRTYIHVVPFLILTVGQWISKAPLSAHTGQLDHRRTNNVLYVKS
jgi:hypothetical protein